MRRTQAQRTAILERIEREGWSLTEASDRLGIPKGTLGSWRNRAAEGLQTGGGLQTGANSGPTDGEIGRPRASELLVARVEANLDDRQARALWMVLDGKTVSAIARELTASRNTVSAWMRDPVFINLLSDLRRERDMAAAEGAVQGAMEGLIASREVLSITMEALRGSDRPEDVARLSMAALRAAGDLRDRGGHPKTERVDLGAQPGAIDRTQDPREALREELEDIPEAVRLRLVGG